MLTKKIPKMSVGLFVTCLVDLIRPSIAWSTIEILEKLGCSVLVPQSQTCCGQPTYNSGATFQSTELARNVIKEFEAFDYIVVPSGSCAGMIKRHYLDLLGSDEIWFERAKCVAEKTYELTVFLAEVLKVEELQNNNINDVKVTYHDSCSGLRELNIKQQPRKLLRLISGTTVIEGDEAETCCGFGGLFCVKYPEISENIVDLKVNDILKTEAELVLAGDLGCLMNIAGRINRCGKKMNVRHVAEFLAGSLNNSSI